MYRHGQEELDAVTRVMKSGQWFRYGEPAQGHQQEAATFETEWARSMGTSHACFTSSGTAALMCCYAGLGVGPGDEVIIPGFTWVATAMAPLAVGAIPIIVDVDESLMIDPEAVERAITPRTKVINPVHMVGFACDMERLMDIARRHRLHVVEDACQCDGGYWKDGRRIGTIGDMGAYSFNFYKVISCGDGGMFVTNRRDAYERGLILHDGGSIFRPHAREIGVEFFSGMNLRGNEILAAIMRVQLRRLDGIIGDLHRLHRQISAAVEGAPGVTSIPYHGGSGTGTRATLGYRFADEKSARAFCAAFNADPKRAGATAGLPIDSGRHVYSNWEPILNKRGAHSPAANPYNHPRNAASQINYGKDMLPKTLEILRRTVLIAINPDWSAEKADQMAATIRNVAAAIGGERDRARHLQRDDAVVVG